MDLAVIAHKQHREWLLSVFASHPEFDARIVCFADWAYTDESSGGGRIPVIPLERINGCRHDAILIAVPWPGRGNQCFLSLHDMNAEGDIYVIRPTMMDAKRDFIAGGKFEPSIVDQIPMEDGRPYV